MSKKKVVNELEGAILRVCKDIKSKQGASGSDKIDSLSKLINSYSRLLERGKRNRRNYIEDGNPGYLRKQEKEKSRKGVIR